MSKAHRGKPLRSLFNRARGECPVCKRTSIKLLYEIELEASKTKVCKQCKAKLT